MHLQMRLLRHLQMRLQMHLLRHRQMHLLRQLAPPVQQQQPARAPLAADGARAGWVQRKAGLWDCWPRWWLVLAPPAGASSPAAGSLAFFTTEQGSGDARDELPEDQMRWSECGPAPL